MIFRHPYCFCSGTGAVLFSPNFLPAICCSAQPYSMHAGHFGPKLQKKRVQNILLSTLISLYKLLGTGDFVKVLLILLKGLFG